MRARNRPPASKQDSFANITILAMDERKVRFLGVSGCLVYIITTPLRQLFRWGPYQNVSYFFLGSPLNVKLVAEHPSSFLWRGPSKYLQNASLHFQGPFKNTLRNVAYILGTSPLLKTLVIIYILYNICRVSLSFCAWSLKDQSGSIGQWFPGVRDLPRRAALAAEGCNIWSNIWSNAAALLPRRRKLLVTWMSFLFPFSHYTS